jgi:hypothetical protein
MGIRDIQWSLAEKLVGKLSVRDLGVPNKT